MPKMLAGIDPCTAAIDGGWLTFPLRGVPWCCA